MGKFFFATSTVMRVQDCIPLPSCSTFVFLARTPAHLEGTLKDAE